jgi:uncharacterized protein (TIGR03083 family)
MSAPSRTKEFWLDAMRREGAAFRAAVTAADPAQPVPSCPDWTVQDLVSHLGTVYRGQHARLIRGVDTKPTEPFPATPGLTGDELLRWWDESFALMYDTLAGTDPDAVAWNWSVKPSKAAFWHRRMAHETAMHRWDAQVAIGLAEPVETDLAVDGVDEVLDTFLPAGRQAQPAEHPGVVRLHANDADVTWAVRIRPNGVSVLDIDSWFHSEPEAQAAAIGAASDLDLALWGRVQLSVLTLQGDVGLLSALRCR